MTQFKHKTFSVQMPGTDEYRDNWEKVFGKAKDLNATVDVCEAKLIFVCSPLRATATFSYDYNIKKAEDLCRTVAICGDVPFAPHVFFTRFLNDEYAIDREIGIQGGIMILRHCDELWVYKRNDYVSTGMQCEIDLAHDLGIKVVINPSIWNAL